MGCPPVGHRNSAGTLQAECALLFAVMHSEVFKEPELGLFDTLNGRRGWRSTLWSPASLEESRGWRAERDCARITPAGEKGERRELTGARQCPPQGLMGRRLVWLTPTPAKGEGMKENSNEGTSE